jgi:N-acetylmuramoyl-L-alanine amidase
MKIIIDAGHGGTEAGAVNGSRLEKNDNLNFSRLLYNELRKSGYDATMTRDTDKNISINERAKTPIRNSNDLFISIHRNSFTNSSANGFEIWTNTISSKSTELAKSINNRIKNLRLFLDRGVKSSDYYGVLRNSVCPAMLIEIGFISNDYDNKIFDENQNLLVGAIVETIRQYYKSDTPDKKFYTVQVGAFEDKQRAETLKRN